MAHTWSISWKTKRKTKQLKYYYEHTHNHLLESFLIVPKFFTQRTYTLWILNGDFASMINFPLETKRRDGKNICEFSSWLSRFLPLTLTLSLSVCLLPIRDDILMPQTFGNYSVCEHIFAHLLAVADQNGSGTFLCRIFFHKFGARFDSPKKLAPARKCEQLQPKEYLQNEQFCIWLRARCGLNAWKCCRWFRIVWFDRRILDLSTINFTYFTCIYLHIIHAMNAFKRESTFEWTEIHWNGIKSASSTVHVKRDSSDACFSINWVAIGLKLSHSMNAYVIF